MSLLIFWLWPLAPPRLMPASYHFIDTAKAIGGMGPADKGSLVDDNAYAAMPSLHIAWSMWCALVFAPAFRHWWARALVFLYPVATLFCIVVTANHYILDAAGGALVLGTGYLMGRTLTRVSANRQAARVAAGVSA